MPKTLVAQNVASVNPLRFVWNNGQLTELLVSCDINFGEMGVTYEVDILPDLTPSQKTKAISTYNRAFELIEAKFIGGD